MRPSEGHGVVVLAAYRPDPELFAVQLLSIRDQTRSDFRCLIGADGGQAEVRALVAQVVGGDDRFEVVGWDDNLGFYLNFERLLALVPEDVSWVALSDQDDRWYPDKLERLVPLLDHATLATGQGRVVIWPDQQVVLASTARRVVPAEDLLFENHVTGAFSAFRRELLDLALPFPRLHTVTQMHDHWLAMCAVVSDGYSIVDEPLQDYVQHGANMVGEVATHRQRNLWEKLRRIMELADTYEGGHTLRQCLRVCQVLSFEWRRLVVETLSRRTSGVPSSLRDAARDLSTTDGVVPLSRLLVRVWRSTDASNWVLAQFIPGIPAEAYDRIRARRGPRLPRHASE